MIDGQTFHRLVRLGLLILASLVLSLLAYGRSNAAIPEYAAPQLLLQLTQIGTASALAGADFNRDGRTDIVVVRAHFQTADVFPISILLNTGTGGFVDATASIFIGPPPVVQHPREIVIADFNGDGRPDIFVADHGQDTPPFNGFQNQLVLSTPDGRLQTATANLPQQSDFSHSATAADIDGDGDVDLYVGNLEGLGTIGLGAGILLNDGCGHFTVGVGRLPSGLGRYTSSLFVDVNNDGVPDLVLGAEDQTSSSAVLINDGAGAFTLLPGAMPPKPFAATAIALDVQAGDLNGDGFQDLVIAFTKGVPFYQGRWIQIVMNNGNGTFRDETASRLPQADNLANWINFVELIDLDGDGDVDLLTRLAGGREENPPCYLNAGGGVFVPLPVGFGNTQRSLFVALDIDRDGGRDFFTSVPAFPPFTFMEEHYIVRQVSAPIVPGIPRDPIASRGNFSTMIRVTWPEVWGATQYEVWRSTIAGAPGALIGTSATTELLDTSVVVGVTYFYSVRATNAAGTTGRSIQAAGQASSTGATFADVPRCYWAHTGIESLVAAGVTAGCASQPPRYCPEAPVTREQMAAFLLKAKERSGFLPDACLAAPFSDVACSSPFSHWIAELVRRGITAGCGGGAYCPGFPVTREQMAVFLLKTREDAGYAPPACVTGGFLDVPCGSPFAPWIYELVTRQITAGCASGRYCPTDSITRAQMAVFLVKMFGLLP